MFRTKLNISHKELTGCHTPQVWKQAIGQLSLQLLSEPSFGSTSPVCVMQLEYEVRNAALCRCIYIRGWVGASTVRQRGGGWEKEK